MFTWLIFVLYRPSVLYHLGHASGSFTCKVTMKALEIYYDPGNAGIE